jgi:hypothetical protein
MNEDGWQGKESGGAPPVAAPPVVVPPVIAQPRVDVRRSVPQASGGPALIFLMAVVGAGMFLALKLGFVLHGDPQPDPIGSPGLTAAATLVFGLGVARGVWLAARSRSGVPARVRRETAAYVSGAVAERERRVAELASNPATAQYAPLVERGEEWSDENIAYFEDPRATVTCDHLQPIERAMRDAGIVARRLRNRTIRATCRIDYPALQASFDISTPVRYAEYYAGDRDEQDFPVAFIICDAHTSMINALHPDEAGAAAAPTFPAGPASRAQGHLE